MLALLALASPFILFWAGLGIELTFFRSTGEYVGPRTLYLAVRGVTLAMLPDIVWMAMLYRTIQRIRQSRKQTRRT
jgi:hypothetical protein